MKKLSKVILSSLLIAFLLTAVVAFNFTTKAAEAEQAALTVKGAQVRTEGEAGIRFVGSYQGEEKVKAYGFVFAWGEATASEIEINKQVNGKDTLNGAVAELDDNNQYYIILVDVPEADYTQKVTARAFVVLEDGTVIYSEDAQTRSLAQVYLAAANDGTTTETVTSVINYVSENYKKAYVVDNRFYVNNAAYEYEPTLLANQFIKDWNKVTGESITSMTGFTKKFYNTTFKATQTLEKSLVVDSTLYTFFNKNNQEMLNKWGWVLDYVYTVAKAKNLVASSYIEKQKNILATSEDQLSDTLSDVYAFGHLLPFFESFFTKTSVTAFAKATIFTNPDNYLNLNETINSLTLKVYANLSNMELVKVEETIKLPAEIIPSNGYEWTGWYGNKQTYEAESNYTVTSEDVVFIPSYKAIEYKITYMDGDKELTGLTPVTYTIEDATITLPTYDKDDYVFTGWYDNDALTGTAVTEIKSGSTGNVVLYANTIKSTNVAVSVSFDTAGGQFKSTDLFVDSVKTININTYSNTGGASKIYFCDSSVTKNNSLRWQYKILLKYNELINAYEVIAIDAATKRADSVVTGWTHALASASINISTYVSVGQYIVINKDLTVGMSSFDVEVFNEKDFIQSNCSLVFEQMLVTPVKEGYLFKGWLCSLDNKVYTEYPGYTTNPGDITYTAQWEAVSE